ncbi:DUF6597 domain-containing transcriptional factor [Promicromonospora sp. NPDC050249]|uniref:DUF6597 domain-containing transcriptional factor n=1 Tax=Promicromonospora sp. NPDC050249 TaxID=3154743 RepID=UPI0033FFD4B5
MESYVERPPVPALAGVVRTVWIQRTGEAPYVQRHLPTGGVELHFPIGGRPRLVGPLTGPKVEVIPARTTIVGVRFRPGAAPSLPTVLDDLVDQHWGWRTCGVVPRSVSWRRWPGRGRRSGRSGSCRCTCSRSSGAAPARTRWWVQRCWH